MTQQALPLDALANLARFHREHEKYYAVAPIRDAAELGRLAQTVKGLADRWSTVEVQPPDGPRPPYTGCEDLNDTAVIELSGVLFLEGGGEPAELAALKGGLRARAAQYEQAGAWLTEAMTVSWRSAAGLLPVRPLGDLLGERHRIIANNSLAAAMSTLVGSLLGRAADLLDQLDLTPEGVRADLAGPRGYPGYLYSAALLLDRAIDLAVTSTTLTRDSEPAWRAWQARVAALRG